MGTLNWIAHYVLVGQGRGVAVVVEKKMIYRMQEKLPRYYFPAALIFR